jgi:BirA family biotin operon repressor/biotin-[acetyl-CoA-carboxylase] ligase
MTGTSRLEMAVIVRLGTESRYVTLEELSRACDASRQEVREAISALLNRGYDIHEVPGEGFRLARATAMLNGFDVGRGHESGLIGNRVFAFGRVGSTNDVAAMLARAGAPDGCLVIADEQTRGRGRLGREWYSPPSSGLWFSLVLRPQTRSEASASVSLVCSVGIAAALEEEYGIPARIKWPNDVVVGDRKICGILTEAEFEGASLSFVVVGIGINLLTREADFPPEIRDIATSVRIEAGVDVARGDALAAVLRRIEAGYLVFIDRGFAAVRSEILGRSSLLGSLVRVETGGGTVEGTALDVDDTGALVVREKSGPLRRILAGDVVRVA